MRPMKGMDLCGRPHSMVAEGFALCMLCVCNAFLCACYVVSPGTSPL